MHRESLSQRKLYELLSRLETSPGGYISLYLKPSSFPHDIDELSFEGEYSICVEEIRQASSIKEVIHEAEKYGTGAAILWQKEGNKYIVLPPFPIAENKISTGRLDTSLLYSTLEPEYTLGVVLVAWGSYSIGIFQGDRLVEQKTGTGYIHKKHKKGGSSQKRFARRTEEQKKDFLRKVSNRVEERFANYKLDYIFFGGNRLIRKPLVKECQRLDREAGKISARVLNVRYANRESLSHSLEEIIMSSAFNFATSQQPPSLTE
ncbi:MAG: Vms1/Ankzf1 family peptidyl-tRNA hydrolase [Chloroflexota bacterium]|nr:Vms1/Ankzf1 family peptidyl-tRNA hydrolase [Chloroflexota bacterium]